MWYLIVSIPDLCILTYLDESAYHIENYDMFLSPTGKGRGVILYTKKKLLAKLVTLDTDINESIWCKIHLDETDQMLLGCIYRSPNSTTANSEQLTTLINKLHKEKYSHLLVVGDFNYREINWITIAPLLVKTIQQQNSWNVYVMHTFTSR